jgi:hypothetical protein
MLRVISQDGDIDLPYDLMCIGTDNDNRGRIIAWHPNNSTDLYYIMAEYSNEAAVLKVLNQLLNRYQDIMEFQNHCSYKYGIPDFTFQFPFEEDLEN